MAKEKGKTKRKRGQPTKYKPEYTTDAFLDRFIKHCEEVEELVSLCGLAVYLKVCEETIQEWTRVHPEFSVSAKKIKQISKNMLLNKGLDGEYVASIVKLGLSANHGMHERNETEHSGSKSFIEALSGAVGGSTSKETSS